MNKTVIATLILFGIIFFCAAGTVSGKGKDAASENAAYYHQIEKAYISQARNILDARGCKNSGITMTHMLDETGRCTYVVKLHHERLDKMSQEGITELYRALTSIGFADGEVLYEII